MRRESQTIGKGVVVDSGGGGTSLTYFEQYSGTIHQQVSFPTPFFDHPLAGFLPSSEDIYIQRLSS
jgi:hypothetical protein